MHRPVLETARLRLEPWEPRHGALFSRLAAMPEIMRHIGAGATWNAAEAEERSARALVHWGTYGFGWRAAIERMSGEAIGLIALNHTGPEVPELADDEFEFGWWIDPPRWGRGYAKEGAAAVRDEAFGRLGAPSVVARIHPENAASAAVAAALGLRPETDTIDSHGVPVRIHRLLAPG